MRVCIIVPMHNEVAIAATSITAILQYTAKLPETTLLIIDDGSVDDTARIVDDAVRRDASKQLCLLRHDRNRGYGAALRTGMEYARQNGFDYVLFMDSDLTNHPRYLAAFYERMRAGDEYIKASRYTAGGGAVGVPNKARLLSILGNRVARTLYGVPLTDITNGFRAFRTSLVPRLHLKENGFAIIMEELTQIAPYVTIYGEVPFVLTSRAVGEGQSHFSYSLATCWRYLHYALTAWYERIR